MAQGYAAELVGVTDGTKNPPAMADGRVHGAPVFRKRATFDLSLATVKHANGDTNVVCKLRTGQAFAFGIINAGVTMGASATIAIGPSGSAGKYRAAAVFTGAAPALFGPAAAQSADPLATEETILMTWGTADGPSSGILVIDIYYTQVA